jgi:hypothetical protein
MQICGNAPSSSYALDLQSYASSRSANRDIRGDNRPTLCTRRGSAIRPIFRAIPAKKCVLRLYSCPARPRVSAYVALRRRGGWTRQLMQEIRAESVHRPPATNGGLLPQSPRSSFLDTTGVHCFLKRSCWALVALVGGSMYRARNLPMSERNALPPATDDQIGGAP